MLPTMPEQLVRVLGDRPEEPETSDASASAPPPPRPVAWSWHHLLGFRLAFLYVVFYVLPFPLTLFQTLLTLPHAPQRPAEYVNEWVRSYSAGAQAAIQLFGESVLRCGPITIQPTGSGDTLNNWVRASLVGALALAGAALWTLVSRRAAHHTLLGWLRIALRFYLGNMLLSYGFAKLFPNQMPFPTWDRLMAPYGQATPMSILWTFLGSSPPFEVFTGAAEVLAGLLLFFRHTATLGALIGIAVMANIVMMNLCYDVPVKLPSLNYLAMLGLYLVPDLARLARTFVLNKPVAAVPLWAPVRWAWARWAGIVLKVVILAGLLWIHGYRNHDRWSKRTLTSPLVGAWEVTEVIRNGVTAPLLLSDATLFRRVMIDVGSKPPPATGQLLVAAIQYMDETRLVRLEVDELAKTLRPQSRPQSPMPGPSSRPGASRPAPGNRSTGSRPLPTSRPETASRASAPGAASRPRLELTFQTPEPDVLVLEGKVEGVPCRATFRRVDPSTIPLLTKGFSWIQELPVNRSRALPPQAR